MDGCSGDSCPLHCLLMTGNLDKNDSISKFLRKMPNSVSIHPFFPLIHFRVAELEHANTTGPSKDIPAHNVLAVR